MSDDRLPSDKYCKSKPDSPVPQLVFEAIETLSQAVSVLKPRVSLLMGDGHQHKGNAPDNASKVPPQVSRLYEHPENPLLDIRANHVSQGSLNDCYFMATLASLAENKPELIKNMIRKTTDCTYTVTFPGDPKYPITVSRPTLGTLRINANYGGGIWAHIIEKAHRKRSNKWSNESGGAWTPEAGGNPIDSIALLTGTKAIRTPLETTTLQNLHQVLINNFKNKEALVAGRTQDASEASQSDQEPTPASSIPQTTVCDGHAYSVVSYDPKRRRVELRDQRAHIINHGRFSLSLIDFKDHFQYLFTSSNPSQTDVSSTK